MATMCQDPAAATLSTAALSTMEQAARGTSRTAYIQQVPEGWPPSHLGDLPERLRSTATRPMSSSSPADTGLGDRMIMAPVANRVLAGDTALPQAWQGYVGHLLDIGAITVPHADRVQRVWSLVGARVDLGAIESGAALGEDGLVQVVLDTPAHHLEIDVHEDGRIRWFYLAPQTDETLLDEALLLDGLPSSLHAILDRFA